MSLLPLTEQNLQLLPEGIARPTYDRSAVRVGIVHLGVGGFHRAHQAAYLDELMNQGHALDWGICGVGVLPFDATMRDVLRSQQGLYSLMLRRPDGAVDVRIVGSIVDYLFAPDDPEAVVNRMVDPAVRIVSLTITEGGYNIHHVTGAFDTRNPDVRADVEAGATPRTAFGLVVEALRRRRSLGHPPFAVLSCDNIQHNGVIARRAFTSFAALRDPELAAWMDDAVDFPSSMVDRITPMTTDGDRNYATHLLGLVDAWPVVCEPFQQWVVQDTFRSGRPPLDDVGVQLVDDVGPYEQMKLRLLNASHQAVAYLGYLAGYRLVHEACQDSAFVALLRRYMDDEASPTLAPVTGVDLSDYKEQLLARFANPYVADTLARLCAETSDRIPKFLLPVVRDQLAAGGDVQCCAAVIAAWARYAEGIDEAGETIEIVDQLRDSIVEAARQQRLRPTAFIEQRAIFGDLVDDRQFCDAYIESLHDLHTSGARTLVAKLGKE